MKAIAAILVCLLPIFAIASPPDLEARTDRLRDAAMERFERGDRRGATRFNERAIRLARQLPPTGWRSIENYDDAGLYYYDARKWKASAQNQAIAVLLACGATGAGGVSPVYVERLGWAFAKYRPHEDFAPVAANPLVLLTDVRLNLRANHDLRRRYFKTIRVNGTPAGTPPRYIYRLQTGSVPESCYSRPQPQAKARDFMQIHFITLMAPELVTDLFL